MKATRKSRKGLTVALSVAVLIGMGGLMSYSITLYELFCAATGYGGTTRTAAAAPGAAGARTITVRFNADTGKGLAWRFAPRQKAIDLRLGEQGLAFYGAANMTDKPLTGTATFNVTPAKAGQYFNKIDCFCFTEQRLTAGQSVDMPVIFFIDPALAEDRNLDDVHTITLSYTMFPAREPATPARDLRAGLDRSF